MNMHGLGNDITDDRMDEIATIIAGFKFLEELFMDDNEIGTEGAVVLSKSLSSLPLTRLSLCTCELTAKGAIYIARYVMSIHSLTHC